MFGYRCRCVWQEWAHVPRGVVQFHCGSQLLPTGSIAHIAAGDVETNMPSAPIGSEFSNDKARILEMGVQVSDLASEWEGHTLRIFQGIRGVLIGSLNGVRVMGNRKQHFGEQGESLQDNT